MKIVLVGLINITPQVKNITDDKLYRNLHIYLSIVTRNVLFIQKVVLPYRCKTQHMFGKNCPVVMPIPEDSSMSIMEQSSISLLNQNYVQPYPTVVTYPTGESLQEGFLTRTGLFTEDGMIQKFSTLL